MPERLSRTFGYAIWLVFLPPLTLILPTLGIDFGLDGNHAFLPQALPALGHQFSEFPDTQESSIYISAYIIFLSSSICCVAVIFVVFFCQKILTRASQNSLIPDTVWELTKSFGLAAIWFGLFCGSLLLIVPTENDLASGAYFPPAGLSSVFYLRAIFVHLGLFGLCLTAAAIMAYWTGETLHRLKRIAR